MAKVRNSAKALIIEGGRLLVIKKSRGGKSWYLLPGGGQDHGETLPRALRRECLEEIGARVKVGPLLCIREYIGANHEHAAHDAGKHQVDYMFRVKLLSKPRMGSSPDKAQVGIAWLPLKSLDRHALFPKALKKLLRSASRIPFYLGDVN